MMRTVRLSGAFTNNPDGTVTLDCIFIIDLFDDDDEDDEDDDDEDEDDDEKGESCFAEGYFGRLN